MLDVLLGLMLVAAQDVPPLAGSLPPLPPPRVREDRRGGPLFITPMGEPVRAPDPVRFWFDAVDTDHDGALTVAEFVADADRFFIRLDRGKDGEIDPDDVEFYETVLAPEIRTGGGGGMGAGQPGGGRPSGGRPGGGRRGGGGGGSGAGGRFGGGGGGGAAAGGGSRYADVRRGAARFGFFDYPEPIIVADTNFNRGVDPKEFRSAAIDRFAILDKNHDGRIKMSELPRLAAPPDRGGGRIRGAGGPPSASGGAEE